MTARLLSREQRWTCPNCDRTTLTRGAWRPNLMHPCPGLRAGLTAPMVPAGTACKVEALERADYVGAERVQLHHGRPVMSVVTTRDTGQDALVFAPTATAGKE